MRVAIQGNWLELVQGDITEQQVDAVVNAANSALAGGGGVDGAIHRRGGPEIMRETRQRHPQGCPTGSAVITAAGQLPARFVIHAVGPRWRGGASNEETRLHSAYTRSLELALDSGCNSVAFPALSAGAYGYPLRSAARVALRAVGQFLGEHPGPQLVRFVLFDDAALAAFAEVLRDEWGTAVENA